MTQSLAVQPWMTAPATCAVMDALEAAGGADSARFVGGCVRNTVLRRVVDDIDIATALPPERVIEALGQAGLKWAPTGLAHGTVTAISRGHPFEITTLRRDIRTDGRHAVVAFTDDWSQDAARRDFRLNSLYLTRDGTLFDPTGAGLEDAKSGRVVFVGDPKRRIEEDHLRILRFFRFFAWFGRGEPNAPALEACRGLKDGVRQLSAERISKELLKLLGADDPRAAMRLMSASGVLSEVLPEVQGLDRFEGLVELETELLFAHDPSLRLAALLPDDAGAVTAAAARLRLSSILRSRLTAAVSDAVRLVSWMSPREMRRAVYKLGQATFKDRITLAWAASDRPVTFPQWRMLLVYPDMWTPPVFPLTGQEIMAAGVPMGPLVGEVRREVETWWVDQDFTDDAMAMLEHLKAVAQGLAY